MATPKSDAAAELERAERTIAGLRDEVADLEWKFQRIQNEFYVALVKLGGEMEILHNEPIPLGAIYLTRFPDRVVLRARMGEDLAALRAYTTGN